MSKNNTISIFSGKPKTRVFKSHDGGIGYRIIIREFTPLRAKIFDRLEMSFGLIVFIGGGLSLMSREIERWSEYAIGFATLFAIWAIIHLLLTFIFTKATSVKITANVFSIKSFGGRQNFDRRLQHKFALLSHDEAPQEKIEQELEVRKAQAKGKIIAPKTYYGQAYHLIFEHMGQRRDITTIYGHNEALAVLARLKACDQIINAKTQNGNGTATDPRDQWGDQTGDIPNN